MPTGVMFHSICKNNQSEDITFHVIIDNGVTEDSKASLRAVVDDYSIQKKVVFYVIEGEKLSKLPCLGKNNSKDYITQATYYRLFLTEFLPANIEKVLYLDVDMIVRGSLSELWNVDLGEYGVGVVPDAGEIVYNKYYRLHYSISKGYFNAGVILINLRKWRENDMLTKFVGFIDCHSDWIKYHDQDVLNYIFRDDKMILPVKYNFQEGYLLETPLCDYWKYEAEISEARNNPIIIHYTDNKPWWTDCKNPLKNIFYYYQSETIWKNTTLYMRPLKKRFLQKSKEIAKEFLVWRGICPPSILRRYIEVGNLNN